MAIIRKDDRFLLIKRGETIPAAGYWCPVSGKIEVGETQAEAVAREVKEEIGLEIAPIKKVSETLTDTKLYRLHWWTTKILSGEPRIMNHEVAEIKWLTKDELKTLHPVYEADIEILLNVGDNDFKKE